MDTDALKVLVDFAGGLPVLAHEIGDAAFRLDEDRHITLPEALTAVISAAEVVGRKHLEPRVLDSLRSERYRTILRKIPKEAFQETFSRSSVLARLSEDEIKVFDNFLRKMSTLSVITKDAEHGRGAYRFTTRLHYLYFFMEANAVIPRVQ